jgi:hypothetical protein
VAFDEGSMTSPLAVAEDASRREPQSRNLPLSRRNRLVALLSDANLIPVPIVFIAVCLLALGTDVSKPYNRPVFAPFGT